MTKWTSRSQRPCSPVAPSSGPIEAYAPLVTERVVAGIRERLDGEDADLTFYGSAGAKHDTGAFEVQPVTRRAFPDEQYFALARHLAEDTARRLMRIDRRLFTSWLRRDLRDAFVVILTLGLAVRVLPDVLSFLGAPRRSHRRLLVNTGLHAEQLPTIERYLGVAVTGETHCVCTASNRFLPKLQDEFMRLSERPTDELEELPRGASVVVCGAETEVARLGALADVLGERGDWILLAKTEAPDNVRACEQLRTSGAAGVISAERFRGLGMHRETTVTALRAMARLRKRYERLDTARAEFALLHLVSLLELVRTAASFEQVVERIAPPLIAGALERSIYGPVALLFQQPGHCAVASFQHGTVLPAKDMDLQPYAALLTWNERSKAAFVKAGFKHTNRASVVGNPEWDALATLDDQEKQSVASLRAWASGDVVVAAFPQPNKGPFMTSLSERTLYEWLHNLAVRHERLRILVKMRADALAPGFAEVYAQLQESGRVRFVDPSEHTIADVLSVAHVGVSIFSTALNDTIAAGLPAISVDVEGVASAFDFHDAVRVCRDEDAFDQAVAECVTTTPGTTSVDSGLLPRFTEPFPRRLGYALDRLSVLPPVRARQ